MQFGAMNYPIRPVLEEIEVIGALGFDYFELAMDPPEAHHETLRQLSGDIQAGLERYQMGLVCHLPTFISTADLTASIRQASRQELLASIEVAAHLGAQKAVLHPSCITGMGRNVPALAEKYARESLAEAVASATHAKVDLCLENLFPQLTPFGSMDEWEQRFTRYPHLGLTLDIGHAHIGPDGMKRILIFIQRFASRLRHLHVSDNFGRRDDHLPIGDGRIDFPTVAAALRRICYQGGITLEVFSENRDDLVDSRDRLKAMLSYVS
jgi:sugar phosphate isomerase/epimerase